MAKFRFVINVSPEDIPNLDDNHKRDCADALNKVIGRSFKYTMIMSLGIMAFYGLYTFFCFIFLLRMEKALPQLLATLPLAALAAFLLEFLAGAMNKWAIAAELLLNILLAFAAAVRVPSLWLVPFALYGAFIHLKLLTLTPIHRVLAAQKGYPEFPTIPGKEEISQQKKE